MKRFLVLLAWCITSSLTLFAMADETDKPPAIDWKRYRTVEGQTLDVDDSPYVVVCFLGCECPLAKLYGPRLARLAEEFEKQGVAFVGVNSNPQDSVPEVQAYLAQHGVWFPTVKDAQQHLARTLSATRTPEVLVLDKASRILYRGRIDDQYQPGVARSKPTRHDLHEALTAIVAGQPAPRATTPAAGCLITFLEPASDGAEQAVTFSRDVAPILNQHCVECHREGEIGPFALTDYDEVIGWGKMMLEVIDDGRMPPWHADPRYGKFVGARHFPASARKTIADWLRQGMPEGDPAALPPQPTLPAEWSLPSAPDEEFTMRESSRPFVVPAEGIVEYQYFVVDPKWKEDKWIRAAQVVPGNASVVHHSIVFVRPPDGARSLGIGWMGAYVPGQRAAFLPPGHARLIPAGSKLIFQMHYTPNGRVTEDLTKIGVWFSDPDVVTHEVVTRVALDQSFEIQPGDSNKVVKLQMSGFMRESRLLSATPHMHLRGKSFRLDAVRNGQRETLLHVPRYDFNWQHWYRFQEPLSLDEIDSLQMSVTFDNSPRNPFNPAANEYVWWGDQTNEEMAVAFFDIAHPRGKPRIFASRREQQPQVDPAVRADRIKKLVEKFLGEMDANGDGVVTRDEAPTSFRRFAFWRFDANRDDRLNREEIERAAAERL